ncbi:MAG: hypoxanthine phosphoribosyltransferase [Petroclostridium sp.]|jgi:hypoxanthine phosphoribosyltransferase|uniref:hypoxanthine phosphoribosyltransferase n=1 Tax=Petroclostridium xylanilyticum TaxID=1792311 RepID=UPI000B985A28|nr:hypoxanthine phosphoribosyltransferase [Petroclostridium xylanilyticum]MBZ4646739.1 Hpt [Clostridia bacterium]MDK2811099.1 hypoxanthine phosphoribosyltransferase [Petroclostridium sp.]
MLNDIAKVLITQEQLQEKTKELGKIISEDYRGKRLMVVCVLKGGVMFTTDLIREISIPVEIDFMAVSSYGASTSTSGVVRILKDLETDIEGKDILIVEDIIDSGLTLKYLKELLISRGPKSVKICTILNKPARRQAEVHVDYKGFDIPDEFVVGYGLDYAEKYRNLPFVGVLKSEVYMKKD